MKVISRQEARDKGLNKYYTGKPCTRGHTSYRYTQSGTCAECIAANVNATRQPARVIGAAKREALAQLAEIKIRAYPTDIAVLRETAAEMCLARHPVLEGKDVTLTKAATDSAGGTALYAVLVPPNEIDMMRGIAEELLTLHGPNVAAIRDRVLSACNELAEALACPVPARHHGHR